MSALEVHQAYVRKMSELSIKRRNKAPRISITSPVFAIIDKHNRRVVQLERKKKSLRDPAYHEVIIRGVASFVLPIHKR